MNAHSPMSISGRMRPCLHRVRTLAPVLALLILGFCAFSVPRASAQTPAVRAAWQQARDLADGGRHDMALMVLDSALVTNPSNTELQWLRAAITGESGRHAESVTRYRRLLAQHPELGRELELDLARVLGWMGKHREAAKVYRGVLARDAGDRDALLGLAKNENWMGRHRRAATLLGPVVADSDASAEALKTLAFARYWSGDSPAASMAVERALARDPGDRETLDLARRLRGERTTWVQMAYQRADDSDPQRVGTTTMELHAPIGDRSMGEVGWRRDNERDNFGTSDPLTVFAGLEHVWSAAWIGRARVQYFDLGEQAGNAYMGEASLTARPMDGLRIDGSFSREPVLTRLSLSRGISTHTLGMGVDYTPFARLVLHAAFAQRRFTDENRTERTMLAVTAPAYASRYGQVWVGFGAEQLNTRLDLDNGYYDPDYYVEWGPRLEADWWPARTLTVSGAGRTGWQREKGTEAKPLGSIEGSIEWKPRPEWTLLIGGTRSSSNLQTASGYERRSWRLAATRGF